MADETHTRDDSQLRIRDLEIVNEVAQILGTKLDTDELLQAIVTEIADKLDCTHCTLFFPQKEKGEILLVPRVTHGVRSKEIMTRRFKVGDSEEGLAGWVFRTGEALVLDNAKEDNRFAAAREKRDAPRSMLVAPVKVGNRTIGVISADQDVYGHFSESDRRLAEVLAQYAGIAIERAIGLGLLQDISARIISAQSVDEILRQIVSGAIELTNTTAGVIYLISDDGRSVAHSFEHPPDFKHPPVRMEGEGGITRQIIKTGEVMIFPNIREDPRVNPFIYEHVYSMVGVPLKLEEKVIGVLYLNDALPHDFTDTEISWLTALTSHAALAVRQAGVEAGRARMLDELQEISALILSGEAEAEAKVWQKFADRVVGAVHRLTGDDVALWLPDEGEQGWRIWASVGLEEEHVRDDRLGLDDSVSGQAMKNRQPIALFDIFDPHNQPSFKFPERARRMGCQSVMIVPLLTPERALGTLSVYSHVQRDFAPWEKDLISTFANQAAIAFENARLLERERVLRQRAEALREASHAIRSAQEARETANRILDELRGLIEYRTASLQLIRGDMRTLLAGRGFDQEAADRWFLRPISHDRLIRRVVTGKEPLVLSKPSEDPDWGLENGTTDVKSWVGVPLVHEQETVGLLTLDHDQAGFYTQADKAVLAAFADQIATDMWNVRFFDSVQRRIRDLEIVNEVAQVMSTELETEGLLQTIVSRIMDELRCTHCTFFSPEEEDGVLWLVPKQTAGVRSDIIMTRRFKPGEGLAGWVFQHGESLVLENASEDQRFSAARNPQDQPRSMLVVPVRVGERTIGVISADQDAYGWFTESDRRLVDALAQHAGIAIERATSLELLRDINTQISAKLDVEEILGMIIEGAMQLTGTDSGVIHLVNEDKSAVIRSYEIPEGFGHLRPRFSEEKGMTWAIVNEGRTIAVPDITVDDRVNPKMAEKGVKALIGTPLTIEGETIGALFLNDSRTRKFTEYEQDLLSTLSGHAAIAIRNARLFEQVQEEVAERGRAQEALAGERNLLRTLIDNLPDYIYAKDTESRFILANTATARLVGKTKPDEILGKRDFDFFPGELAVRYRADEEEIMQSGQPLVSLEEPVMDHEGNEQWVLTTKVPLRDSQGSIVGLVGLNRDITERKQAEEALEERATQLERLQAVTATISAKPSDLEEILRLIVDGLGDIFPGASRMIRLYDIKEGEFTTAIATGVLMDLGSLLPRPGGTSRHVVKSKLPRYLEGDALVEPPDGGPVVRKDVLDRGVMAAAYLPLLSKGDVIGVLSVFFTESHRFSKNDKQILELFAGQAAIAIENARLYERLRRELEQNKALSQLGEDLAALERMF